MLSNKFFGFLLCFYLQIINTSCEGSSLAFAIDDTSSMDHVIQYIKQGARAIMELVLSKKSDIKELVLVTFNDPYVELRTQNTSQHTFLTDLASVRPHDGGDCPEMALTGIETAMTASKPESYIFVFTDANPKDYNKVNEIRSLCQKKQIQVVIVYTINMYCYSPHTIQFKVYYDVAKACSGQVFIVKKDQVPSVLKTIETLLQGKNAIFKWVTVPTTPAYVPVEFTLDEKAEFAIVSTSGNNVDLKVSKDKYLYSPEVQNERTMWNNNSKVVKLIESAPGTYYAWVKGQSTISMVVYGRTNFTFQHGFSILEPKHISDTAKQPTAGLKQHVSINVTDPDNSTDIKTVQILDMSKDDNVIYEFPLRNTGKDFYVTDAFVSPSFTFRIAVKSEIKSTRKSITRISKNIEPQIIESLPDINIEEGVKLNVNYGSNVTLTCKVNGHPAPKIKWYTSNSRLLKSKSSVIDDPLFVSYLKLENIKHGDTYICKASNIKGAGRDGRIEVGINPIFTVIGEAVYYAKYREDVKIPCNIKSYLPITTKWFTGKLLSVNSGEYSISHDGSELTLKSMDIPMLGTYACEATLNSDPTIKQTREIDVYITGLAFPKVTEAKKDLKEKKLTAICRIEGVPKPTISWQFQAKGSAVFSTLPESTEELHISGMTLQNTGVYRCIGKSVLGKTEHDFDVVVDDNFEGNNIFNGDSHDIYIEEGKTKAIKCNLKNVGESSVRWYKDRVLNTKAIGSTYIIENPSISDEGNYTCRVNTDEGSMSETYVVYVGTPPSFVLYSNTTEWLIHVFRSIPLIHLN